MYIFLYRKYMVKNLEEHIRDQVCEMLNEEKVIDDFRALARLLKYKESEIEEIGQNDNPTNVLLEDWGTEEESTVGNLIEFLKQMKRHDVIGVLKQTLVSLLQY